MQTEPYQPLPATGDLTGSESYLESKYAFLKGAYSLQKEKKEKLRRQAASISVELLLLGSALVYLSIRCHGWAMGATGPAFWLLMAAAVASFGYALWLAVYCFVRSYHYAYFPNPHALLHYICEMETGDAFPIGAGQQEAEAKWKEYLANAYANAADYNLRLSACRGHKLQTSRRAAFTAGILILLAASYNAITSL